MFRVGDRVQIRGTGETGKVLRVISIVKGVVLNRPLAIVRLHDPDPDGVTLTTAFVDELEAEEHAAGRASA